MLANDFILNTRISGRMSYSSPLRYPGGKGKLAGFFSQLITANGLEGGTYIEPFAGGAGVAMSLLAEGKVGNIVINDIDRPIHAFWQAVLDRPEDMARKIRETAVTVEEWRKQKKIQRAPDANVFDLGFSTFFLNRTNRSGVLDGGPIGGLEQKGTYKIDARYNPERLAGIVEHIGSLSEHIQLYGTDAEDFIRKVLPDQDRDSTLVYLDPPYYQKGAYLYMNYYSHWDHLRLSEAVDECAHHWVVSYDDDPAIRDFYRPYRRREFCLDYSAYERRKGREIMFFSDELEVPDDLLLPGQRDNLSLLEDTRPFVQTTLI